MHDLLYCSLSMMHFFTCSSDLYKLTCVVPLSYIMCYVALNTILCPSLRFNKCFTFSLCMSVHIMRHLGYHFVHTYHTILMQLIVFIVLVLLHILILILYIFTYTLIHACYITSEIGTLIYVLFIHSSVIHLPLTYAFVMVVP